MALITLLSDFGTSDGYVAQMKARILRVKSRINIVDISHGIQPHNILMGSYVLETTVPFFPRKTIHVGVVDPGVGSSRLPIVIACKSGVLIGPDNGLLARASDKLGFRSAFRIRTHALRGDISTTFHGRDIFAVVAAKIAEGEKPSNVGPKISRIARLKIAPSTVSKHKIAATVLHVDNFGNIILNVSDKEMVSRGLTIGQRFMLDHSATNQVIIFARSYSEIRLGELALLKGSQGYFEVAKREDSAARSLRVKSGDRMVLRSTRSYRSRKYRVNAHPRQSS